MKMNNILKFSVVLLGVSVMASGCIEETFPEGSTATQEQIAGSEFASAGAVMALPTVLITNQVGWSEHIDFGYPALFGATDRLAGEIFPVCASVEGGNVYTDRFQSFHYINRGGMSVNTWAVAMFYENYYKYIQTANSVIASVSGAPLGIAKAYRAMAYLDMARLYDPLQAESPNDASYEEQRAAVEALTVPLVTETTTMTELENNPRVTRDKMFEFILQDLNDAETLMADYVPSGKNLPSLAAVYGLKARTYLWLGGFTETYENVPTGNDAYKLAAEYAQKAITASNCTIMTEAEWLDPKSGFTTVNGAWIWGMVQSTDTVLGNLHSFTAHMSPEAIWGYGYLSQPGISVFTYDRIAAGDFRKKNIVTPDRNYKALQPYTTLTEEEFMDGGIAPMAWFKFHTGNGEKRDYSVGNVTSIPLMRVEEMYLIQAEAVAHYDEATGKSLLESFMSHRAPGYKCPAAASSGDALIEEIIFQKRMEFWGEGISLYDMKRIGISMHNGDEGSNAPGMMRFTTNGRAPWWNLMLPLSAVQQNVALQGHNNPDPSLTVKSND